VFGVQHHTFRFLRVLRFAKPSAFAALVPAAVAHEIEQARLGLLDGSMNPAFMQTGELRRGTTRRNVSRGGGHDSAQMDAPRGRVN
jgi:hypothetical protein